MNILKQLLQLFLGFTLLFSSTMTYAVAPQNSPAAPAGYTKIPGQWQVTSAYGPRDPGSDGSKFHKGIDYSQNDASLDKGVMLQSREKGTIGTIETGNTSRYISVFGAHQLAYVHIFDDTALPITLNNANITNTSIPNTSAKYSRVALTAVQNNLKKGTCGAIFFYKKDNGKEDLDKILTQPACSKFKFSYGGRTVTAQTKVLADEYIAPMGTSLPPRGTKAHLHLQLNSGKDNVLAVIDHSFGRIAGKEKDFEIKLVQNAFSDSVLQAMTNGQGFAIEVTENNLVPVLDAITVSDVDDATPTPMRAFFFGGKIGQEAQNVTVDLSLNFAKGSSTPKIKPVDWKYAGTPRTMTFFVPYASFASLAAGDHTLKVSISTIDQAQAQVETLTFTKGGGCAKPPVKLGNLEVQSCDFMGPGSWSSSADNLGFTWDEAMAKVASYGAGWRLPTRDELNLLYENQDVVGGFADYYYWSSTENDGLYAWIQDFTNGYQDGISKDSTTRVRAVRALTI